jgi:hypothetical protein
MAIGLIDGINQQTVIHDEEYILMPAYTRTKAEGLWPLLQPWVERVRGLSKQDLKQAARTYGFLRSINPAGTSHGLVDCFAADFAICIGAFRLSTAWKTKCLGIDNLKQEWDAHMMVSMMIASNSGISSSSKNGMNNLSTTNYLAAVSNPI